jgi:hypothetical protein
VGPSIGGAFILQLLEFLQHRGLAAMAFQRGITETEWNSFLEIVPGPVADKTPAGESKRLIQALLEKKVVRVSLVSEAEQPPANPDLSWQVRLAYARLARDLRSAAALGQAAPATLIEQSERLATGMGYSYFRKFDVIRGMLFNAGTVDKFVQDQPVLRQVRALDILTHGIPPLTLHGTTKLILGESGVETDLPPEPAATVLRAITERLLKTPSSRQVDEILRTMCRRKIVPITRLPVELQEWVLAENWVESMRTGVTKEPPKGSAESNPVRILQKGARYAFVQNLPVQATSILERIKTVAPKAVPEVFDMPTVEAVLTGFPENVVDRRALLALLEQGGDTAADSVAAVIVNGEAKVREAAAWILTEMKARGVEAALRALGQEIDDEEPARLLLACVSGKAPTTAADVIIRQCKHKSARVRRDALTALASACPPAAEVHVALALEDPDENVRIRALLLCATTGVGSEKIIPRAIRLVSKDARGAPPNVVRAGIEVVVRRREAGTLPIGDAEAALCRLATPIGVFGRMLGQTSPPAAVLVTAIAALGRLGTDRAEKLLGRLSRSKDPDIALAAHNELDHKGGRRPSSAMPTIDSGVISLDKKASRG